MNSETPWKAEADVFVVTQPPLDFVKAMVSAASRLEFEDVDADCRFYVRVREVDAPRGRAVVVTDVAEYTRTGAKKSAVVVSGVVEGGSEGCTVTVRTHLEDQHTRFDGDMIVFEEHHDAMREVLVAAVMSVEPEAVHRDRPQAPPVSEDSPGGASDTASPRRRFSGTPGPVPGDVGRFDLRSLAGMGLLAVGVLLLLVAVASGSFPLILFALVMTGLLGWAGQRIAGV